MTVRERILLLRILEKQEKNPVYAEKIGVHVEMVKKSTKERCSGA